MKNNKRLFIPVALIMAVLMFSSERAFSQENNPKTLKEVFKGDFVIGTALNNWQINKTDKVMDSLITNQFNAITAENVMKSEEVHPKWGEFHFEDADKFVEYGKQNNMYIVGHTMVWHSQLPDFVHAITDPDSLRQFMDMHIKAVGERYASSIDSWDVVNEALNEDGTLRESIFYKLLGEDYIVEAFKKAAVAAPKAALYYNDYNIEQPKKRAGVIRLIKKLQESGVRIDGIGIQGHWNINDLDLKVIEESIQEYAKLGMKVAFTELDLSVLPNPWDMQGADVNQNFEEGKDMNPYPDQLPDSVGAVLADKYEQLFNLFLKYRDDVSRVTLWGVSDRMTWLNNFPIRGRTNYPLLFDRNNQPKEAFNRLINIKNNSK
ncbi:endo-1,4-beta-xylanase [Albibacterium sp.]|uniref:endo-1,4-beta-xylanase n=1 Tax=Albibacterium sp. TaxID=2952885 RepID=UPI002B92A447|nr:endo-1,4-beta-xylanase [Albibacterium sp.]HUH19458.1 endo-1,4-beta-xylanase [Albibacterium sp.]